MAAKHILGDREVSHLCPELSGRQGSALEARHGDATNILGPLHSGQLQDAMAKVKDTGQVKLPTSDDCRGRRKAVVEL